jgi:hypothetical protein
MSGRDWSRLAVFLVLAGLVAWWLVAISQQLATAPTYADDGTLILDPFQRAKDILTVLLPLLTAAIGFYAGAEGKEKAEELKEQAEANKDKAQAQLTAVTSVGDPDILAKAKEAFPEAFDQGVTDG